MKAVEAIIQQYNHNRVAFLIGNGPNLKAEIMPSWKELLIAASQKPIVFQTEGLTNTEVYDLVELCSEDHTKVKERVCEHLAIKETYDLSIHNRLMELARANNSPVLTTNFDEAFEKSIDAALFHIESKGFTRFYPWKTYYGFAQLQLPTDGFGIWKIHGDVRYKDSIRLGLTDYMGSAERARRLIHNGEDRLFKGKRQDTWQGHQTWLHIWFNLPIIIFGFSYDSDEVFLRWLLIERKRYLNLYQRPMNVWYISNGVPKPSIANLMQTIGVQFKQISNYSELYD
jgi:hypothetical protein